MTVTLSSEEQLVTDLGERRDRALKVRRDLAKAHAAYFARVPAMTAEGVTALQAVDDAERTYPDFHEQWLQVQRRIWNSGDK